MLKATNIAIVSLLLSGCSTMPGMDNINTHNVSVAIKPDRHNVTPTLIPITASLIEDQKVSTYVYRVCSADVLQITVWQHPEFVLETPTIASSSPSLQGAAGQKGYLVDANGEIFFPLVGYVRVAGKTVNEIRADISKRLEEYIPNPQLNVRVSDFRGQKVYVVGEVNKVGFLPITDQRLTLADALALSGWTNHESADTKYIYVIRGTFLNPRFYWLNAKTADRLLLAEYFSMQPQDILYVSSAPATRWNRVLNQLLPTIQTIWYTQAVVKNA